MSEKEIILEALVEYEKNNCMYHCNDWQKKINELISRLERSK